MPGARWFEGARAQLRREHASRGKPRRSPRGPARLRAARARARSPGASCASRSRAWPPALRGARRRAAATASSPTCRTRPRPLVAFLATASIGAIWSSCSPDFGARSVVDRFAQIEPKVLLLRRRLPLQRPRLRPPRDRRRALERACRRSSTRSLVPYLDPEADDRRPAQARSPGPSSRRAATGASSRSSRSPSTTRSGSSTRRGPPGCRRRSSRATAGSCSSS